MAWNVYGFCMAAAAPVRDTIKSTESFNRRTDTHAGKKNKVEDEQQQRESHAC